MQTPGTNPDIPETAEITFARSWNRSQPGTKVKMAFLELSNGRRLAVFPDRQWDPPLGEVIECVLWPVRNAAIAAPVGGIPDGERLAPAEEFAGVNGRGSADDEDDDFDVVADELMTRLRHMRSEVNELIATAERLIGEPGAEEPIQ